MSALAQKLYIRTATSPTMFVQHTHTHTHTRARTRACAHTSTSTTNWHATMGAVTDVQSDGEQDVSILLRNEAIQQELEEFSLLFGHVRRRRVTAAPPQRGGAGRVLGSPESTQGCRVGKWMNTSCHRLPSLLPRPSSRPTMIILHM